MKVLKNCSLTLVERKKSLLMQYVFLLIFSAISAMWLQKFNLLSMVTPSSLNLSTIVMLISLFTWIFVILMTPIRLWLINGYKSLTNFCQDDLMTPFYEDQYYFFKFGFTFIDCWLRDDEGCIISKHFDDDWKDEVGHVIYENQEEEWALNIFN